MIDCPNCKIKFSPGFESCPHCRKFRTPREERARYHRQKAEEYAEQRATRDEVRSYLIEHGFSDLEADETLKAAFRTVASENRSYGCGRTVIGGGILLLGVTLLLVVATFAFLVDSPMEHGGKLMARIGFFGVGLTILGLLALVSGLWSTTTGK